MFILCNKSIQDEMVKLGFKQLNMKHTMAVFRWDNSYHTISKDIKKQCKVVDKIKLNFEKGGVV